MEGFTHDDEQAPSTARLERWYRMGDCSLVVKMGDLLTSDADVLVSSDDYLLSAGGGISAALARGAGSATSVDAAKLIPRRLGDVVVTTAGALAAKYIFHAVTIGPWDEPTDQSEKAQLLLVKSLTTKCLHLARTMGLGSIAFPALGAGVARLDVETVATGMAEAIADDFAASGGSLEVSLHLMPKRWQDDSDYMGFFEEAAYMFRSRTQVATTPAQPPPTLPERAEAQRQAVLRLDQERVSLERQLVEGSGAPTSDLVDTLAQTSLELAKAAGNRSPVHLFISYAREDEAEARALLTHLTALKRDSIAVWSDRSINPGADWEREIHENLEAAEIGLFLISSHFVASEYCTGVEWRRAREREAAGEMRIVPIILKPCLWERLIGDRQALPPGGAPVSTASDRDEVYTQITRSVEELAISLREWLQPEGGRR